MSYYFIPLDQGDGAGEGEIAVRCGIERIPTRCGLEAEEIYSAICPVCKRENLKQGKHRTWRNVETCEHYTRLDFTWSGAYMYFRKIGGEKK